MPPRRVIVRSPTRLHFGLFSFGHAGRQFGGVGVMVQSPAVVVELTLATHLDLSDTHKDCVESTVRRWSEVVHRGQLPNCRIVVHSSPPRHVGLGSGTQLALSVAAGLHAWHRLPAPNALDLAELTGRGMRSAVGTYGFLQGGLIVESGKLATERLSPLQQRIAVPGDWRFVLLRVGRDAGLHGSSEHKAFNQLPPVKAEIRTDLENEVQQRLLPALARGDVTSFGESVYRYGRRAGDCFAAIQGGPYSNQRVAALVDEIRTLGIPGVGQSSWGPTLFCITEDHHQAADLVKTLQSRHGDSELEASITSADNSGARVVIEDDEDG